MGIIVCGLNGSGKSTLAKALAQRINYHLIDIEDIYFPEKSYGDVNFPEGIYTAYRIIIGKGEGANWWCVLYPPLCFLDITHGVLPEASKEVLKQALTEEEYSAITNENRNPDRVKIEFKLLPFLNDFIS